ncbi:MAG: hypothetical protein HXY24_01580 [Rubrivivax sp.]|nr:hypothetical protein [Rubrivivax sp.]
MRQRLAAEDVVAQLVVEGAVVAADPLEQHRGVLLLLVAVVHEDGAKLRVLADVDALVAPVDRLQLLGQRLDARCMPRVASLSSSPGSWYPSWAIVMLRRGRTALGVGTAARPVPRRSVRLPGCASVYAPPSSRP